MKRVRYDQESKAAIIAAVHAARKGGKSWAEALGDAEHAGYKGTVGSLTQFVNAGSKGKKIKAPKGKMKTKAKAKHEIAAPKPVHAGHLDINALVHKTVTDAVANALEALIASIKTGK